MRIALVAPPWVPVPPRYYGGTELVIDLLARGFAAAGHEVVLFATGDSACPVPKRWTFDEAQGQRMSALEPELRQVLHAYGEIEADGGFDIVHDHTVAGPVVAGARSGPPVVTTVHNPFDADRTAILRALGGRVQVIAISEAQRREAVDLPIAAVIHHGIEATAFPYAAEAGDYCFFIGRMAADKGAANAVAACQRAGYPLKLAGKMRSAEEIAYFESEVAPHLSSTIEYLGEVDHADKVALVAGARATLFPIRWSEPFGLVMLESLACGTPVIATPSGAVPEVLVDGVTGFLCDGTEAMADRLGHVEQIDRAACRAAVEGPFSAARMVADHLRLFATLVPTAP